MSKITKAIAYGNPEGAMLILKKYKMPRPLNMEDMIVKLDKIGNQWTDSHVDFAGAHPDGDFFRDLYSQKGKSHDNCAGDSECGQCASKKEGAEHGPEKQVESFYKENQKVIILGLAIIAAAIIFKR